MFSRLFIASAFVLGGATPPAMQIPFLSDVGELLGVQFTQPRLQLHGVVPFIVPPTAKSKTVEGQQAVDQGGINEDSPYETNERGQFLNVDSYARALSDQYQVPPVLAKRIAEVTKAGVRQMVLLNSAVSDWLGAIENGVPDPAAIGEPLVVGMDAAATAIPQPALALTMPVLSGMMDLFLTGLSTAVRIPSDLILEAPRYELSSLNELLEVMAPIVTTDEFEGYSATPANEAAMIDDTVAEAN